MPGNVTAVVSLVNKTDKNAFPHEAYVLVRDSVDPYFSYYKNLFMIKMPTIGRLLSRTCTEKGRLSYSDLHNLAGL